ncbi:MAG: CatA-like O-acetyltransferase [Oscillospiraceae bacterium]
MTGYTVVDMEQWPRKDHYAYYTQKLNVGYSMTIRLDVTKLLDCCHQNGYKFYPTFIYCVTSVINRTEALRMFQNQEGELCIWDDVMPNYTIFHEDDSTFSDCWTAFSSDFVTFYRAITDDMERYQDIKGIKAKPGQPANFFCISCVPWIDFTGYSNYVAGGTPQFFPIITFGKYTRKEDTVEMPFNLTIAHAVCDGYHTGCFFRDLQEEINNFRVDK